jgi:uncharacterized protein with PQ loop repeat
MCRSAYYASCGCTKVALVREVMTMLPCDGQAICKPDGAPPLTRLEKVLRILAVVTMVMTIPQAVAVWRESDVGGVSLISWVTYLAAAIAWLVYGIQKRDRMIYLECIGWIVLDVAIIAGIVVRH